MKKQLFFLLTLVAGLTAFAGERTIMAQRIKNLPAPWIIQPRTDYIFASGTPEGRGAAVETSINYDADEQVNVWVKSFSLGENTRKADIFVNGTKIGSFGDEYLSATVKKNQTNWVKAPAKIALKNGENKVKIVARSEYARIAAIYFSSDDNADPSKERTLPEELTGEEYTKEINLVKLENVDFGNWKKQSDRLTSEGNNLKEVTVVMEIEFDAPVEQNVAVWGNVFTSGGGWRTTAIYINDLYAGNVGDGKIQPGKKAGQLQWEKAPKVVRVNKGKNILTIQANSPNSRIGDVIITNDPEFEP